MLGSHHYKQASPQSDGHMPAWHDDDDDDDDDDDLELKNKQAWSCNTGPISYDEFHCLTITESSHQYIMQFSGTSRHYNELQLQH
jgi:hypothetical protein